MIRAVIFDLYGTLIHLGRDTKPYTRFARAVRPGAAGEVLSRSLVISARSLGDLADTLGLPRPEGLDELEADLRGDVASARLFDDALDALARLRGMGLKLGLISNLATPYKGPLDRLRLGGHFDVALLSCDLGFRKPQPAIYLRMAQGLGLVPEEMVMVGDSPRSDHDGPKDVGMEAVLLCRHGGRPDRSAIGGLRELPGRIRSLMGSNLSDR